MCQNPGFGYNQASEVRIEPIYFLFFSVLPRPEFLFSCTNLGHWPNACDKQNFRVLAFLLVRWSLKQRHRALEETEGAGGPKQFIYLLGFSVPQCLRGAKVLFLVAASSRRDSVVQRFCLRRRSKIYILRS